MSKKKFKKGLESLFGDWGGEPIEDVVIELERTEESEPHSAIEDLTAIPHSKKDVDDNKANAGKNFTTDLDFLFQEVMHESIEEQLEVRKEKKNKKKKEEVVPKKKKRKVIPRSGGIDSLIRSTIEGSIMQIESTSNKKRVSFVFDKEKLKKLKSIAKVKKSYLKDIIDEVVAGYLAEYESRHGHLDE